MLTPTQSGLDLETLVRRHQAGVWRYLRLLGVRGQEAEDLCQETFLLCLQKRVELPGEAAAWSWLQRTARFLVLRQRRAAARKQMETRARLCDALLAEQEDPGGDAWLEALRACVAQLEGRPRAAIELFYAQGLDRQAAGAQLGMKETGFKTLLQRTRAQLRRCLQGLGMEEQRDE